MMDEYYSVAAALPEPLAGALQALAPQRAALVQEIRLRAGQPVSFTVRGALVPCTSWLPGQTVAAEMDEDALQRCFLQLCHYSAYAYEEELRCGFFTAAGGSRIGVAGEWGPGGFGRVTALNLRVARWVTCPVPAALHGRLAAGQAGGLLVAGPPGSGKTTLLRTLVKELSQGNAVVCVVDERDEILAGADGAALRRHGIRCDAYTRCPKSLAIEMALRCMNPQVIVCDELGGRADAAALEQGVASGVRFVASVHCDVPEHLRVKPQLANLLATGAFETAVFLAGRAQAGKIERVVELT